MQAHAVSALVSKAGSSASRAMASASWAWSRLTVTSTQEFNTALSASARARTADGISGRAPSRSASAGALPVPGVELPSVGVELRCSRLSLLGDVSDRNIPAALSGRLELGAGRGQLIGEWSVDPIGALADAFGFDRVRGGVGGGLGGGHGCPGVCHVRKRRPYRVEVGVVLQLKGDQVLPQLMRERELVY